MTITAPKMTTINLLQKNVPNNYKSAVSRLKEKLGGTIENNDTPFDIALIATHIGEFEHGWVKSHTSCHAKSVPVPVAAPTPTVTETPVEQDTPAPLATQSDAATATASTDVRVIGGKRVPPVDPNGVITESATTTISVAKNGINYTGSIHLTLGKMQQTMLRDFAAPIAVGTEAHDFFTKLSTGVVAIDVEGKWASSLAIDPLNNAADVNEGAGSES